MPHEDKKSPYRQKKPPTWKTSSRKGPTSGEKRRKKGPYVKKKVAKKAFKR